MRKTAGRARVGPALGALLLTALFPTAGMGIGVKYQITKDGLVIERVSSDCPMIYDNDWWFDTPDKNYLWAKASFGQADLCGNIVTRDMWDWQKGYFYKLEQGMKDARKSIAIARRSGLKNIPEPGGPSSARRSLASSASATFPGNRTICWTQENWITGS